MSPERDFDYIERANGGSRGGSWDTATVVTNESEAEGFLRETGMDFDVETHPIRSPIVGDDGIYRDEVCDKDLAHWRRNRDNSLQYFGVTGPGCPTFQNMEALEMFQEVCAEENAEFHKGGTNDNGRFCWLQAKMPQSLSTLNGDEENLIFTLGWGHGGKASIKAGGTVRRMACLNMYPVIRQDMKAHPYVFVKHTLNMRSRINAGIKALRTVVGAFEQHGEMMRRLRGLQLTASSVQVVLDKAMNIKMVNGVPQRSTQSTNIQDKMFNLFESGRGYNIGAMYSGKKLLDTVAEYVTHHRSTNGMGTELEAANRYHAAVFGSGNDMVARAASVLLQRAA